MDVTPLVREGLQLVQTYTPEGFKVSAQSYNGAVIVTPEATLPWDGVSAFSELTLNAFERVILSKDDIDVVLLGTGAKMAFLPKDLQHALQAQGITVDCMDTGAACRTFNVLVAEGRRVIAMMLTNA
jgi:uncharacterized protein